MTTPRLPSAEERTSNFMGDLELLLDELDEAQSHGLDRISILRGFTNETLEAAAEVADGSVKPGWLIAKDIRALKEDL